MRKNVTIRTIKAFRKCMKSVALVSRRFDYDDDVMTSGVIACGMLMIPQLAMAADGNAPVFSTMLNNLTQLVNTVFLPIAIFLAGAKIIYLAIFPGIMGSDPFNQVPDGYSLQWDAIWTLIKQRLTGFFRGLMWIGGIWILFNLIVSIVGLLAGNLENVMSGK